MNNCRKFRPRIDERLEPRLVLSALGEMPATAALIASLNARPGRQAVRHFALQGIVAGSTRLVPSNPDTGSEFDLDGSGQVRGVGLVSARGTLHKAGFIRLGQDDASLTLSNNQGSVTLHLTRSTGGGAGSRSLGEVFRFTIAGGTGAYQGARGGGSAELELGGPLRLGGADGPIFDGSFNLALNTPLPFAMLPMKSPAQGPRAIHIA